MNKLHKLLIIALILIMGGNTLKAENLTATRNSDTELVTKNQDLHSHDNFINNDNHVASTLRASAAAAADLTVTIDTGGKVTLKDADGDGYYEISTADELYAFAAAVNGGNRAINGKLTANIVVNQNMLTSDGDLNGDGSDFRAWIPINNSSINGYNGTFDGGEHTVSSLYFNNINTKYVGLFGNVASSGKVANVGVIDTYFNGYSYIGGVVGKNSGTVSGCYNTSTVMGIMNGGGFNTSDYIGGVVGYNSGTVSDCYNNGSVSGIDNIGGVVGDNSGTVSDCYNNGSVSGSVSIGGVVGYNNSGIVSGCYNIGNISGNSRIGGVVGYNNNISDDSPAIVTGCYNNGNVSGNNIYVGGIVGDNSAIVRSCYNTGNSSEGGVVGGNRKDGTVTNCYYDSTVHTGNAFYFNLGTATDVLGKTTTQFASGEVAYLLQGEQEENVWGQTIGTDAYPVLGGEKVYRGYESCGDTEPKYTNDENISEEKLEHSGNITYTVNETDNTKHDITYSCCGMVVIEEHVSEKEENKATCKELAVCDHCGESYGELTHTGGTATCTTQAVCEVCGESYGEIDPNNHEYENNNGFCNVCDTHQPATLVTNENYESLGLAAEYVGFYQIGNAGQLYWFANHINTVDRTASAVLTADIDLEGKSDGTGRKWTPIGSTGENSHNFRGVFDGQNHTIKGLYVEGGRAGLGFFGEVRTGTVKNFTIYGEVVVNTEVNYVGGVIGSACGLNGSDHGLERNGAIIQNITSYVNLTAKTHGVGMIGGFVGYANHQSLIENCSWYGTFDAGIYRVDSGAGGFIGRLYDTSDVTVRNCAAYGTIKTAYESGTFENYSTIYIGGFLSYSPSGAQTVMQNNLWAGEIINNTNLTPENAHLSAYGTLNSEVSITNCYADSTLYVTTNNENTNGITTVTAERLASGEIAYLLQGEQETQVWGQNIDNGEMADAYPVLGGAKVYEYTSDYGDFYSNLENLDMIPNGKCGDKLYWNITDNTLTIFGTGTMWNYDNDSNKAPWIEYSSNLETLVLEEEMTSIGDYAFYECSGFTGELKIPNSVSTIGQSAFFKCSGFTGDLIIPNSVTSIGNFAFMYCSSFTGNLTIGNSVTSIGYSAFNGCSGFTGELMIGNSVTSIDHNAFYECSGFTGDLKIPNSVSTIGQSAFFKCSSFTGDLIIPNSVTSIGNYAFRGCSGFTGDLIIPNSVTSVGKYAFYMCSGFTGNLIIPNSVTSIGDYAFDGCSRFTGDLIIPNNVTSIGDYAFRSCSSFTGNLTIPNSVTFIGDYAFDGCSGFTGSLAIGNSVTSIGDYAFRNYSGFTGELIIPNSVTSIGDGAFYACSELTDVFFYKETSPLFGGDHVFASLNKNAKIYAPVIWESFKIIPPDKLVKMPTWTSQQDWVGLAEGQIEPGENDHVVINAPMELSRQVNILKVKSFGYCGDGTTTNGSITIEEGGQLYCETARDEVTVRKEILGYQQSGSESESKWYTIASPLKEAIDLSNSNTFITSTPFDLYRYDEPTHTWQNAKPGGGSTNFQTIEPGRGYLYANAKYTTLEFKGNINTEDVNYTLTAQSEVLNGFHLVGNPYTHDISFNHLSADAELANGYYVLNGEGAWGATLGNEGDVIKVGQGALIKTTEDGTLRISKSTSQQDNESTSRDASNMYRSRRVAESPSRQVLKLSVANSNYSDKAFVVLDKGVGLDKINHENENIPLLYIPQDGIDYAIAMMDENVSEIPVSFEAMTMGQYTISLQQENCDFEELYLLDKETGEKVNILEEDYTFMATTYDSAERFVLTMNSDNDFDNDTDSDNGNFAYISGEDLIISVEGAVQIIDVMGRIIYTNDVTSDNSRINVSGFDNAAYVVRVVNENGVKVQKIIL